MSTSDNFQRNNKKENKVKKILTEIVIIALALLMVGGLLYAIQAFRQETDTSNVYGYYDGVPVKYEPYNVFASYLEQDDNYKNGLESNNVLQIYNSINSAYNMQLLHEAAVHMAKKTGISISDEVVDKLVVNSDYFDDENGNFSNQVYKNSMAVYVDLVRRFLAEQYPYTVFVGDLQTANLTKTEYEVLDYLAEQVRSFEYFVIEPDYNICPDNIALSYDISGMEKSYDEEGNEIEPTLSEIKAYIFSKEPSIIMNYIEDNILPAAVSMASEDFSGAANKYSNGFSTVENAAVNIAGSSYLSGIESRDSDGRLNSLVTEDLYKQLYSSELGQVLEPVEIADNGGYVVIRVSSVQGNSVYDSEENEVNEDNEEAEVLASAEDTEVSEEGESEDEVADSYSQKSLAEFMFSLNGQLNTYGDMMSAVFDSDKHDKSKTSEKILTLAETILERYNEEKKNSATEESTDDSEVTENPDNPTAENEVVPEEVVDVSSDTDTDTDINTNTNTDTNTDTEI